MGEQVPPRVCHRTDAAISLMPASHPAVDLEGQSALGETAGRVALSRDFDFPFVDVPRRVAA